ncbi:MAG: hypothetical protein R3185_00485 [Candidatus Thermoplasmatota archaeon]|nr:hypothetical protein [Candidatus Thermoplasmatota archaeon]
MNILPVRIHTLEHAPGQLEAIAAWYEDAWEPHYGPEGPGNARGDLETCLAGDQLPICLVALDRHDAVIGTATLREDPLVADHDASPWLGALLAKGKDAQLAEALLIDAIAHEAQMRGYSWLHTEAVAEEGFERRGWQPLGQADSPEGPVEIYGLELQQD